MVRGGLNIRIEAKRIGGEDEFSEGSQVPEAVLSVSGRDYPNDGCD